MTISRASFLQAWRFTADPFGTTNAEQERGQLAEYFVRAAWFDRLVGDPRRPESLILFAPRGYGKTSHRIEAARWATTRRDPPALVVDFTDVDLLLPPNLGGLNEHIAIIRRKTLEALDDLLSQQPKRESRFLAHTLSQRFAALLLRYAPLRALQRPITPEAQRLADAFDQTHLSAREWLRELARLAQAAGCASVYVMIDGVDEHTSIRAAPEVAVELLSPLLDAPGLLQECDFAFKFFLPEFLHEPLRRGAIGRLDRIPVLSLDWTDEILLQILAQRLASHSLVNPTTAAVRSFGDLCEPAINADRWLVGAAHGSPRELLRAASAVLDAHCAGASDSAQPITAATIARVLGPLSLPEIPEPAGEPDGRIAEIPPLRYDTARGDLWVGAQRRTPPPLSRLQRRCMEYLWIHRDETVAYQELEDVLYGDESDALGERGDPRGSLEKIIRRLRSVIEPGRPASQTYIAVQPGVGYLLCNTREP